MPKKENTISFKKIILERTMCLGPCPAYRIEILANGTVNYEGGSYVEKNGTFSWKIDPVNIQKLQDAITKAKYFDIIENPFGTMSTCMPGCITTISMYDGRKRTIDNNYGENNFPRTLKNLEKKIDHLSGVLSYVGNFKEE